jgi:hypothetical protein
MIQNEVELFLITTWYMGHQNPSIDVLIEFEELLKFIDIVDKESLIYIIGNINCDLTINDSNDASYISLTMYSKT